MSVTLEQIQELMSGTSKEADEINYPDFTISAKTNLTISEKINLVESVVNNSYINGINPSSILSDIALKIAFIQAVCPAFPFPAVENNDIDKSEAIIDSQLAVEMIDRLDLIRNYNGINKCLYDELKQAVAERMEFENQKLIAFASMSSVSDEILESVAAVANKTLDLATKGCGVLDELKDLAGKSKTKILKHITAKNINKVFDAVKKNLPGIFGDEIIPDDTVG